MLVTKYDCNAIADANYELLDFGDGRKLERFGDVVLNRPCPAAEGVAKSTPKLWDNGRRHVSAVRGRATAPGRRPKQWMPAEWHFEHEGDAPFRLQLEALPSGQVGVFPEQRENWDWIARQVLVAAQAAKMCVPSAARCESSICSPTRAEARSPPRPPGRKSCISMRPKNIVDRAKQNAEISGLADRPIRWIAEDALKFCQRELKRGNQYDAVILDPPTFGHGPKGEPWQIKRACCRSCSCAASSPPRAARSCS